MSAEAAKKLIPLAEAEKQENRESGLVVRRVADIQAQPIRWLWRGRIARGKVSMVAGNPGLGKSQLTASLAAIVTTGTKWPVDRTPCERGSVIILSAEDDPGDTIRPRLEAAGADLERCYILDAVKDGDGKRSFNLKTDLERLGRQFSEIGDVALAVIDPITAYLGGTDSHKNADVRALLAPLSEIASRHSVAIVCISHLNKASGGEALSRVMGSLAFVAAARAAYVVTKDQADGQRRLFLPAKNNIGNDQTGLAFTVRSRVLSSGIETSRIEWEPDPVTITADEALAVPSDPGERDALTEAKEFLSETLAAGPVSARKIYADADAAGHSKATVRRAKDALGIKPAKTGLEGGWAWELPKMLNGAEDAQQKNVSTFGGNEHLRETKGDWEADL